MLMDYAELSPRIRILSRKDAEKLLKDGFPPNTAVITFVDPPDKKRRWKCEGPGLLRRL